MSSNFLCNAFKNFNNILIYNNKSVNGLSSSVEKIFDNQTEYLVLFIKLA